MATYEATIRVEDDRTGEGIEGFLVSWYTDPNEPSRPIEEDFTDDSGIAEFEYSRKAFHESSYEQVYYRILIKEGGQIEEVVYNSADEEEPWVPSSEFPVFSRNLVLNWTDEPAPKDLTYEGTVRVKDQQTGDGLEGLVVSLYADEEGPESPFEEAFTDESGIANFEFRRKPFDDQYQTVHFLVSEKSGDGTTDVRFDSDSEGGYWIPSANDSSFSRTVELDWFGPPENYFLVQGDDPYIHFNRDGAVVKDIQDRLTSLGQFVPQSEIEASRFGEGTSEAVRQFQSKYRLPETGRLDESTKLALNGVSGPATSSSNLVDGFLYLESGAPAPSGITLKLYEKSFGSADMVSQAQTQAKGYFTLDYGSDSVENIEVVVVDDSGNETTISETVFRPDAHEVMNLVAPRGVFSISSSEWSRLKSAVDQHLNGNELQSAKENNSSQDVTMLADKTNWDARLIALAVKADRLSNESTFSALDDSIATEAIYGLLRTGMPSDKDLLAGIGKGVVDKALTEASDRGVVALSASDIDSIAAAFRDIARQDFLSKRPATMASTPDEVLGSGGVSLSGSAKNTFVSLLEDYSGENLWDQVESSGEFDPEDVPKLRAQGKLGFLTGNNSGLVDHLMDNHVSAPDEVENLVDAGLYAKESWENEFSAASASIEPPEAYRAVGSDGSKLESYAEDLARKVRISFPTRVLQQQVLRDEVALKDSSRSADVSAFVGGLKSESAGDEEFGAISVNKFEQVAVEDGDTTFFDSDTAPPKEERKAVFEEVKRLDRLYQITPNDKALRTISELGFDSAHDIGRVGFSRFKRQFKRKYDSLFSGSDAEIDHAADLICRKVKQVEEATTTVVATASQLQNSPAVFSMSPTDHDQAKESAKSTLADDFPTMESLFGSLDFCECEHCRSVLSPAAYKVDLLQFVDWKSEAWKNVTSEWEETHGGDQTTVQYPFRNEEEQTAWSNEHGSLPDPNAITPYDVLVDRRPDIPHIALTCENTNTSMPYIDVVNEIFEYYIADNQSQNAYNLDSGAARNTGGAESGELLAEPQYVVDAAYETLRDPSQATYPIGLPFDLWTEKVRKFMAHLESPLSDSMETMRTSDALQGSTVDASTAGDKYHRIDVFREQLGLTPSQWQLFTQDHESKVPAYYGYSSSSELVSDCESAKTLSRLLDVSYKELDRLVKTRFVNPKHADLTILRKLGVTALDLSAYQGTASASESTLPEDVWSAIDARVNQLNDKFPEEDIPTHIDNIDFSDVWVLKNDQPGCDFAQTNFQRIGSSSVTQTVLLKLNLLVRLWRATDWQIDELDKLLCSFVPTDVANLTIQGMGGDLETALVYLAHTKVVGDRLELDAGQRTAVLSLWSTMNTDGTSSRYSETFLNSSDWGRGEVWEEQTGERNFFDHPFGDYLAGTADSVSDRMTSLRAGLELSEPEILEIVAKKTDTDEPPSEKVIDLETLSLIDAYGTLSKSLDLEVEELLDLEKIAELNPTQSLADGELANVDQDNALELVDFLDLVELLEASDVTPKSIAWLVAGIGVPPTDNANDRPDPDTWVAAINSRFQALESDLPTVEGKLTDKRLRELLSSVVPGEVTDAFMGFWTGELTYGESDSTSKTRLLKRHLSGRFAALVPEDELSGLFSHVPPEQPEELARNRQRVANRLVPFIRRKRQKARLLEAVADRFSLETEQAETLLLTTKILSDEGVLDDRSEPVFPTFDATDGGPSLFKKDGFTFPALGSGTLSSPLFDVFQFGKSDVPITASFHTDGDLDGEPNLRSLVNAITTEVRAPSGTTDARFEGYFRVPEDGDYTFVATVGADQSSATVTIESLGAPILDQTADFSSGQDPKTLEAAAKRLESGNLYHLTCEFAGLNGEPATLSVSGPGFAAGGMEQLEFVAPISGFHANFYTDGSLQTPDRQRFVETMATTKNSSGVPNPDSTTGAEFYGYIQVPETAEYEFSCTLQADQSSCILEFPQLNEAVIDGVADVPNDGTDRLSGVIELQKERLYEVRCQLDGMQPSNLEEGSPTAVVEVGGPNLARGSLQRLSPLSPRAVSQAKRGEVFLAKAAYMLNSFELTARELSHVNSHASDFNFSNSTSASPEDTLSGVRTLMDFAQIKGENRSADVQFVDLLERARSGNQSNVSEDLAKMLADLSKCSVANVKQAATHPSPGWKDGTSTGVEPDDVAVTSELRRIWDILQLVNNLGASVESAVKWTVPSPSSDVANGIRDSVEGSHSSDEWQDVAKSIYDDLRQSKRDALVTHLLYEMGLERREQLFEHFLIDPGMEPVVRTSRIKLALSSIQTFVQRCLMNLEPLVAPSVIDSDQWNWMKRYRVWEANRKIFLYPENWLEPELRENKTPLFQELESSLLEGEITREKAESAFYRYLRGLEPLGNLEIVSLYSEKAAVESDEVLHVLGRTHSTPHEYKYRTYKHGTWSPWRDVSAEIESNHIVMTVHKGRPHVFWVNFKADPVKDSNGKRAPRSSNILDDSNPLEDVDIQMPENLEDGESDSSNESDTPLSMNDLQDAGAFGGPRVSVKAQLNWIELADEEWSTRQSTGYLQLPGLGSLGEFKSEDVSVHVTDDDGDVLIHMCQQKIPPTPPIFHLLGGASNYEIDHRFRYVSRHANPSIEAREANESYPHRIGPRTQQQANDLLSVEGGELAVTYNKVLPGVGGKTLNDERKRVESILSNEDLDYRIVPTDNPAESDGLLRQVVRPFFFQHGDRLFLVRGTTSDSKVEDWANWAAGVSNELNASEIAPHLDQNFFDRVQNSVDTPAGPFPDVVDPAIMEQIHDTAILPPQPNLDWVSKSVVAVDDQIVDGGGRVLSRSESPDEFDLDQRIEGKPIVRDAGLLNAPIDQ